MLRSLIEKELCVVTENFKRKEKGVIRQNHYDFMNVLNETNFFEV